MRRLLSEADAHSPSQAQASVAWQRRCTRAVQKRCCNSRRLPHAHPTERLEGDLAFRVFVLKGVVHRNKVAENDSWPLLIHAFSQLASPHSVLSVRTGLAVRMAVSSCVSANESSKMPAVVEDIFRLRPDHWGLHAAPAAAASPWTARLRLGQARLRFGHVR